MVEPVGFGANPETAGDNAFQSLVPDGAAGEIEERARAEFRGLVDALEHHGIEVVVFSPPEDETPEEAPPPDSVFPNNWFSTHPDGRWVVYPMMAPSRRRERHGEINEWLGAMYGAPVDLTGEEAGDRYLEGTGSLVIDESARVVYASKSARTDEELVGSWAERFECRPVLFESRDRDGRVVYHTNVVMTLGTGYAIVCAMAIEPVEARREVLTELAKSGRVVVEIGLDQLHAFCGNALELEKPDGSRLLVMSQRAWEAFGSEQRGVLEGLVEVVHVDLGTIEAHGGGSARCMLAELY